MLLCGFRRSLCNAAFRPSRSTQNDLSRFLRTLLSAVVAPGSGLAMLRGVIPPVAPEALWRVPEERSPGQHSTQRDSEVVLLFLPS
jgi:hypothetical protein